MGTHFFIDETKAKSYVVVAAVCPSDSISAARRTVGGLVLPGQRSIHMKNENPRRRRQIADAIIGLQQFGVSAVVLDAGRGPEPEHARRARALRAIVERAAIEGATNLVLDLDLTLLARDRSVIASASREMAANTVAYNHLPFASESLLAIPDVIAWCGARGSEWRRRIKPLISDVKVV